MSFSRRDFLFASAGAAALAARGARAQATAPEKPAVVIIFFAGSYNALFSAADVFVPTNLFSCTASNVRDVGNGLVVDAATLGSLPDTVLQRMATVGVRHGSSGHDVAMRMAWFDGNKSYPLMLADALGGTAPFRCVHFGESPGGFPHPAHNGVVMTSVPDLAAAVQLCTDSAGPGAPRRDLVARALRASLGYADKRFQQSPNSLRNTWDGTHTLIGALESPPPPGIDWAALSAAYGIPATDFSATSFASQLAGAELMLQAGADVICLKAPRALGENWDTHSDGSGETSRAMMGQAILPGLRVFLERTLAMAGRNVVTVLHGEFARTGGVAGRESGHASWTSPTVFGKYVANGTTGRPELGVNGSIRLPMATPGHQAFWSFLTAAARAPKQPWGVNPHTSLVRAS